VIIFNTIGGIIMSQSNLEKQEAKLKQLNQKIKAEKNKIEQNLGKQIIRSANLDYGTLTTPQIKMIAKKVAVFLNQARNNR
jgi:tetrahydromethanopterin S-methyltransferase subunit G